MSTINQTKSTSGQILWSRHKGLMVTALSLGFIILAWFSGKYGYSEFEVPFYLLAYAIGGYQKAWEGLQTLIQEKELDGRRGYWCSQYRILDRWGYFNRYFLT